MVSIGIVTGGGADSLYYRHVKKFSQFWDASSERPLVNLVFHFSGTLVEVSFEGLRTAKFSKKRKMLMIQAAVDPSWNIVHDAVKIRESIADTALQALELAAAKFSRAKIDYEPSSDRAAIENWLKSGTDNTQELELETVPDHSTTELALNIVNTVPVAEAHAILEEMGYKLPKYIDDSTAKKYVLKTSARLSLEEVAHFIELAQKKAGS